MTIRNYVTTPEFYRRGFQSLDNQAPFSILTQEGAVIY